MKEYQTMHIIEKTFLYCKNTDYEKSREIEPLEEVIDVLSEELKNRHIQRLIDNKCSVEVGFVWSDLITDFERIADHCSNIAITIVEVGENDLLAHTFKKEKDEKFMSRFNAYKQEYILPEEA